MTQQIYYYTCYSASTCLSVFSWHNTFSPVLITSSEWVAQAVWDGREPVEKY